ncbi:MAG TPA: TolC family protein [Elusimicrobiota bacterium]|nr:TolC family protein [Elusimicrobiota bacterium]HNA60162.1 TolC family protein [Elusimicrobiota bacterium]
MKNNNHHRIRTILSLWTRGAFLLGLILVFAGFAKAEDAAVLTLDRCLEKALAQNPALTLAEDDFAIARARARAAAVSLFPAVTAKADETTGRAEQGVDNPPFVQRSYGVQATQTIFSGGKLWGTQRQASLGAEIARWQLEKQRLDVRHAVTEAYWRVAGLQQALRAHRDAHGLLQEDLEKAVRHDLSEARSARIELLSTRAQNRESEAALAEVQESLLEARQALWDALGERTATEYQVPEEMPAGFVDVDESEALRLARDHRPDTRIADRMMESARFARSVARSGVFPKIDLNGFYGRSASAFIETDPLIYKKDWNVGLSANWAFIGNSVKYSAYREKTSPRLGESSRTETDNHALSLSLGDALGVGVVHREGRRSFHEEEWRYEKSRRDADNDVRLAVRRTATARSRYEAARAKLEEALQEFKDTRSLLQEDRAHLGDLAAARNRVAFAQAAQAQSQAQYLAAVSALNRAVGLSDKYRVRS